MKTDPDMSGEGFLRRWSRRKSQTLRGETPPPEPAPGRPAAEPVPAAPQPSMPPAQADAAPAPPTLDDVARLTPDADFSAFVARGVDPLVRRGALKKLFADPHFNTMDGLDIYIGDYTKPSPVSEAMLASLGHARRVLQRLGDDEPQAETTTKPEDPEDETP